MTLDAGEEGKRDGMRRAEEHASEYVKELIMEYIELVANHQPYLSADIIWIIIAFLHPNLYIRERRVMGSMITKAVKLKIIEPSGEVYTSKRPARHKGYLTTWHSCLYTEPHPQPPKRKPPDPFINWWRH